MNLMQKAFPFRELFLLQGTTWRGITWLNGEWDHFADMGAEAILQVSSPQGVSYNYYQARELHKTLNVLIKGDDGGLGSGCNWWGRVKACLCGYHLLFASNSEHLILSNPHNTPTSKCYSKRKQGLREDKGLGQGHTGGCWTGSRAEGGSLEVLEVSHLLRPTNLLSEAFRTPQDTCWPWGCGISLRVTLRGHACGCVELHLCGSFEEGPEPELRACHMRQATEHVLFWVHCICFYR